MKMSNKKAQSAFEIARKQIFWIFMGLVVVVAVLSFTYIIQNYISHLADTPPELELQFITLRFLENPDCFAYQDSFNGKVLVNTLDINKLNEERMDLCYFTGESKGYNYPNFELYFPEINLSFNTNEYYGMVDHTYFKQINIKNGTEIYSTNLIIYIQENMETSRHDETWS